MVNGISWDFIVLWREWYERTRHRIFYFMAGNANLFLREIFYWRKSAYRRDFFSYGDATCADFLSLWRVKWTHTLYDFLSYDNGYNGKKVFILWNGWKREKSFCPNCQINMHSSFGSRCISRYFYNRFVSKIDISVIRSSIFRIALNRNNIIISWALSFLFSFLINFPTCCTSLPLRFIYMYSGKFILSLFPSLSISLFLQTIDAKVW